MGKGPGKAPGTAQGAEQGARGRASDRCPRLAGSVSPAGKVGSVGSAGKRLRVALAVPVIQWPTHFALGPHYLDALVFLALSLFTFSPWAYNLHLPVGH